MSMGRNLSRPPAQCKVAGIGRGSGEYHNGERTVLRRRSRLCFGKARLSGPPGMQPAAMRTRRPGDRIRKLSKRFLFGKNPRGELPTRRRALQHQHAHRVSLRFCKFLPSQFATNHWCLRTSVPWPTLRGKKRACNLTCDAIKKPRPLAPTRPRRNAPCKGQRPGRKGRPRSLRTPQAGRRFGAASRV